MIVRPFAQQGHWTQVHNVVFDSIMPRVSSGALKVLLLVIRRTTGYDQRNAALTYADIKKGTGIKSDATVDKSLDHLCGTAIFGAAVLLKKTPGSVGAAPHKASKFAINRSFAVDSDTLKNEVYASKNEALKSSDTSKNEVFDTSKNEASYPNVKNSLEEPNTVVENACEKESENIGTATTSPKAKTETQNQPWPDAIETTARRICKIPMKIGDRDFGELQQTSDFVLAECDGDVQRACQEWERYFSPEFWRYDSPPFLSQIRNLWGRQKFKADNANAPQPELRGNAPSLEESNRRNAEFLKRFPNLQNGQVR